MLNLLLFFVSIIFALPSFNMNQDEGLSWFETCLENCENLLRKKTTREGHGKYLVGTKFYSENLINADLEGTDLTCAWFPCCLLNHANFRSAMALKAKFSHAMMGFSKLALANFSYGCLKNANLFGAECTAAKFVHANLIYANLSHAKAYEADFSHADLRFVRMERGSFFNANFKNADLSFARLKGADFTFADLSGADLTGTFMEKVNFTGTILENAFIFSEGQKIPVTLRWLEQKGATWGKLDPPVVSRFIDDSSADAESHTTLHGGAPVSPFCLPDHAR